ncbi:MAG: disulfide bond formation protein B [Pirellulales bacterium]|nr:disulfide bond formation protein B [Pirellulales bacterium]
MSEMNEVDLKHDEHAAWKLWPRIEFVILHFCVLAICGVLGGALWVQFVAGEYPCPLCILQRLAMILSAMGSIFVITHGHYARVQGFSVMGLGYGMSILAAVAGLFIATRQVLLHIQPGDPGYGSPVLGMHLYSWSVVVFLVVVLVSGLMLIFGRTPILHCPACHEKESPEESKMKYLRLRWYSWVTFWVFGAIILINAFATVAESGFHAFLPDNPTSYRLFD